MAAKSSRWHELAPPFLLRWWPGQLSERVSGRIIAAATKGSHGAVVSDEADITERKCGSSTAVAVTASANGATYLYLSCSSCFQNASATVFQDNKKKKKIPGHSQVGLFEASPLAPCFQNASSS